MKTQRRRLGFAAMGAGCLIWLIGLGLAFIGPSAQAAVPLEFSVLRAGSAAGSMTVEEARDGRGTIRFRFEDRGRGPDLVYTHQLDAQGRPLELTVRGRNYYHVPVDESFRSLGGSASWVSAADRGNGQRHAFYLPHENAPEHLAMLARALEAAGGSAEILPAGRASIDSLGEHEITLDGTRVRARLFALNGLGFTPELIWLDAADRLLFNGNSWFGVARRGIEAEVPELIRAQNDALLARQRVQAARLQRRPHRPLVIRDARLFDAGHRRLIEHSTVVIDGVRILAVGRDGEVAVPSGAELIEARGRVLLPGLWDNHVHLSADHQGLLHLANGVTTVRDLANDMDALAQRRARFESGELVGPRVIAAGMMDSPGELAGPTAALVRTPAEVRDWVSRFARAGYRQLKLYSSLDPQLVPVAIAAAHSLGLRVSGHVPAGMTMEQVVEAGFDEVHHANFWFLNFMGPDVNARTNGMARFYAVGERAADLNLGTPEVARFIALLQRRQTVLDPTLVVFERLFLSEPGRLPPYLAPMAGRLPPGVQRDVSGGGLAQSNAIRERYRQSFARMLELTRMLHEAGVTIVPGTDSMAGFSYHRELELYAEAGIPEPEILFLATLGSARVNRLDRDLGSIEPGKLADMVLVDGDPTVRMSDIRRPVLVIRDGVIFESAALLAALGVTGSGESGAYVPPR